MKCKECGSNVEIIAKESFCKKCGMEYVLGDDIMGILKHDAISMVGERK